MRLPENTQIRGALFYVDGLEKDVFFADKRTQQAVILNIISIVEAAEAIAESW
ncbi:hypothetical protein [Glaciimonas sp. PCH181]|uniref:hypothetical protein n=1 Tax=Glaciimonas sp. PCH181 TaxID=2133943 RepID=UPI00191C2368|nr:hypothetical protein [Glaciimonas sp. PCH181]